MCRYEVFLCNLGLWTINTNQILHVTLEQQTDIATVFFNKLIAHCWQGQLTEG